MRRSGSEVGSKGFSLWEMALVVCIILLVVVVLLPVLAQTDERSLKSTCQNNMKEIAVALCMYWNDYDAMLPTSALRQTSQRKTWTKMNSAEFCGKLGRIPPPVQMQPSDIHWVQLLYPHMKNKDIIWCPSDPNIGSTNPRSLVSYIYKPAIERAWYESLRPENPQNPKSRRKMMCFRKEADFEYVADQIGFFERAGWHSTTSDHGWKDGVGINASYLDGHVRYVRLRDAAGCNPPENASELATALSLPGEPAWFNYAAEPARSGKDKWFDPRIYYDQLP